MPFALIGEDGDHFLKHDSRPMTLFFQGKANVNNHAHVIADSENCLAKWFYYCFMHRDLTPVLTRQGVGRYKLTKAGLEQLEIVLPPLEEQRQIVRRLEVWDDAIAATERLLANSRNQKKALADALLTGKARRSGFAKESTMVVSKVGLVPQDWLRVSVGDVAAEITKKNAARDELPVLSCTKRDGLVDSLTYFKKRVFSEDTSAYKVVPGGCFAYATNHIDEGSIGYQDLYPEALISPMYTVFKTDDRVEDGFLYKLFKTEHYRQVFAANTSASVDRRGGLRWVDFTKIQVALPSVAEQRAICEVVDTAQSEIAQVQAIAERLGDEKRALMADLLTGKRRVRLDAAEATT